MRHPPSRHHGERAATTYHPVLRPDEPPARVPIRGVSFDYSAARWRLPDTSSTRPVSEPSTMAAEFSRHQRASTVSLRRSLEVIYLPTTRASNTESPVQSKRTQSTMPPICADTVPPSALFCYGIDVSGSFRADRCRSNPPATREPRLTSFCLDTFSVAFLYSSSVENSDIINERER